MTLVALHGFLGTPNDWNEWSPKDFGVEQLIAWEHCSLNSVPASFETWSDHFNDWALRHTAPPRYLMGYSLGGRLALHALLKNPSLWSSAILISTHPGLQDLEQQFARMEHDQRWVDLLKNESWENFIDAWEKQSIFLNTRHHFLRKEKDYDKKRLIHDLITFSLSKQMDLSKQIAALRLPLLWITGEHDTKFTLLAKRIAALHEHSRHIVLPNTAHRVPWEEPRAFATCVADLINSHKIVH